ncbi:Histone acetyltransferase type B catalytic subunit [Oopsacas minuta]|uniref:Histone acetyltransferase type B catalytic subunit n=1 Tax=Oopsacas minuta TaxID=111878 RepID=A0AAV7JP35_9METZ|nr:Histone acetyltransferase type B catalytic subunit [Oopsacas minuta]
MNGELSQFVSDSTAVFRIYLLDSLNAISSETSNGHSEQFSYFKPKYTYPIFGDEESIFGYKDLIISLYLSSASLDPFIKLQFSEEVNYKKYGVKPDDIIAKINEEFPVVPLLNTDEFSSQLDKQVRFQPHGTLLHKYKVGDRTFQIYRASCYDPGFLDYQNKLQNLMLLFIEGASQLVLEGEDDYFRWLFYLTFECIPVSGGNDRFVFVGCLNAYKFYSFPDKFRIRVSQVLVLPPFQKLGHATRLIEAIHSQLRGDSTVFDLVVEDPSDDFVRLRDFIDCRDALQFTCFQRENIKQSFTKEMEEECRDKLKLHSKQSRRVHEILRLKYTNLVDKAEYREYRMFIKQRLNAPFMRLIRNHEHARKRLPKSDTETELCLNLFVPSSDRQTELHKEYSSVESEYQGIIAKLLKIE